MFTFKQIIFNFQLFYFQLISIPEATDRKTHSLKVEAHECSAIVVVQSEVPGIECAEPRRTPPVTVAANSGEIPIVAAEASRES